MTIQTKRRMHSKNCFKKIIVGDIKGKIVDPKNKLILLSNNYNCFEKKDFILKNKQYESLKNDLVKMRKKNEYININKELMDKKMMEMEAKRKWEEKKNLGKEINKFKKEKIEKLKNMSIEDLENNKSQINKMLDKLDMSIDEYKAVAFRHGFIGFLLNENKIAFALHSSKNHFKLLGENIDNILVDEDINPIKYVNPTHIMDIQDFRNYFEVTNTDEMLETLRYGACTKQDIVYCSIRAGLKSIEQGTRTIVLTRGKSSINILTMNNVIEVNNDGEGRTPGIVKISELNADKEIDIVSEIKLSIEAIKEDDQSKKELAEMVSDNYLSVFK